MPALNCARERAVPAVDLAAQELLQPRDVEAMAFLDRLDADELVEHGSGKDKLN